MKFCYKKICKRIIPLLTYMSQTHFHHLFTGRLALSAMYPLFLGRFRRSLRFRHLEFDKEVISDGFMAQFRVFREEGVEFSVILESWASVDNFWWFSWLESIYSITYFFQLSLDNDCKVFNDIIVMLNIMQKVFGAFLHITLQPLNPLPFFWNKFNIREECSFCLFRCLYRFS